MRKTMGRILHVSKNGDGDYRRLEDALRAIPEGNQEAVTIYLQEGIYREKLVIDKPYITLLGDGADKTIITYDDYALMLMPDGKKRGTFRTQTVLINTHDFTAKSITFENSAGSGRKVGQAIALYVDGDRNSFYDCRILGYQDTLFTGPLPPNPFLPDGFTGPLEYAPRINGRQYYHRCYICGNIDYIFGSATAYFESCELHTRIDYDRSPTTDSSQRNIYGYITAASTAEGQEYGYVFNRCLLTGNCPTNSVYLGRPWRNYAKTVFLECELGEHIKVDGWHDWDKPEARDTCYYAEYRNYGPGAKPMERAPFVKQLTKEESLNFQKDHVLW
jgi:pectinesterase